MVSDGSARIICTYIVNAFACVRSRVTFNRIEKASTSKPNAHTCFVVRTASIEYIPFNCDTKPHWRSNYWQNYWPTGSFVTIPSLIVCRWQYEQFEYGMTTRMICRRQSEQTARPAADRLWKLEVNWFVPLRRLAVRCDSIGRDIAECIFVDIFIAFSVSILVMSFLQHIVNLWRSFERNGPKHRLIYGSC